MLNPDNNNHSDVDRNRKSHSLGLCGLITGYLPICTRNCRYLLHDRDSKYGASFRKLIEAEKVKALVLPHNSPNLNAFAERWIRSVKEECLSKLILFGERSLKRALHHYEMHYHQERNQGQDNLLLFPLPLQPLKRKQGNLRCRERLGGLLKYYEREAA